MKPQLLRNRRETSSEASAEAPRSAPADPQNQEATKQLFKPLCVGIMYYASIGKITNMLL